VFLYWQHIKKHTEETGMIFLICGAMAIVSVGGIIIILAGIASHKVAV